MGRAGGVTSFGCAETFTADFDSHLARIESALGQLLRQQAVKEWYTSEEVALIVHKAPFTVREWCRHKRINAAKRACGRGKRKSGLLVAMN